MKCTQSTLKTSAFKRLLMSTLIILIAIIIIVIRGSIYFIFNMRSQTKGFWNRKKVLRVLLFLLVFGCVCGLMIYFLYPTRDTVCYTRVGCFDLDGPWQDRPRLFNFFPQSPNAINTTFFISSRHHHAGQHETRSVFIRPSRLRNLQNFQWGTGDMIVFIIHGYTDDSTTWMLDLQEAFLELGDITVILVDWRNGASGYYPQVVANTRVVAREIGIFISQLMRQQFPQSPSSTSRKRVHLVGHSLGAQIASYAGKYLKRSGAPIHQITALDPAFPLFEGLPPEIRLYRKDAQHVLAIHSNIGPWGLGLKEAVGTVDIYLNNGRDQRGCIKMSSIIKQPLQLQLKTINTYSISHLQDLIACSHRRAYEVLTDILQSFKRADGEFVAYPMLMTKANDVESASIKFSFCHRKEDACWKLTDNMENYFFQLPTSDAFRIYGSATSFFMPTTSMSPFCSRLAFLEILTCPSKLPTLVDFIINKDYFVTISYIIFGDEVEIYKGKILGQQRIHNWLEFSCGSLLQVDGKLTLLFSVTYTELQPKSVESPTTNLTRRLDNFCWAQMQLTYYHRLTNEFINLKPCLESRKQIQNRGIFYPTHRNHCFEVRFTS